MYYYVYIYINIVIHYPVNIGHPPKMISEKGDQN